MGNELTKKDREIVSLVQGKEIGDIIKPLIREIHLFDSFIAGTSHLEDSSVLDTVQPCDILSLRREENKFDSNAVMILNKDDKKLGYVPEKDNTVFARLMDAGKLLKAKVTKVEKKYGLTQISVGIYLVDL